MNISCSSPFPSPTPHINHLFLTHLPKPAGLHPPPEAIEYLERALLEHQAPPQPAQPKTYLYAITGTGHHSKNNKDKLGKAVRGFLHDWRYAYREFSVPGDRNHVGGILGVDPSSFDREREKSAGNGGGGGGGGQGGGLEGAAVEGEGEEGRRGGGGGDGADGMGEGKIRVVSRDEVMR